MTRTFLFLNILGYFLYATALAFLFWATMFTGLFATVEDVLNAERAISAVVAIPYIVACALSAIVYQRYRRARRLGATVNTQMIKRAWMTAFIVLFTLVTVVISNLRTSAELFLRFIDLFIPFE